MLQWYALYTKPRAEWQVEQTLKARQIETYLPTVKVWRARRRRVEEEPLFSCYLFARVNLNQVGISVLAWTPGLRHIVGSRAEQPTPVPDKVIEYIRQRTARLDPHRPDIQMQRGDRVRIIEGPFKALDAVFEQQLSGFARARVLVEVLGRLTRYDAPLEWLKQR